MSEDNPPLTHVTGGGISGEQPQYTTPELYVAPAVSDEHNTIVLARHAVACWRMDDIRFKFGSSFILPDARDELQGLNDLMHSHPGAPLTIFGHADPVGEDQFNKKLSGRRAQAVYALLTHNAALWEDLYTASHGSDKWDLDEIQIMLQELGYYSGAINGYNDEPTKQAAKAFQRDQGLNDDGVVGKNTRPKLFLAYMDAICVDKEGNPYQLDPEKDFLARGADSKGKGDYQGCGEFNPDMLFSEKEHKKFQQAAHKAERNRENRINRRVVVLLFKPGSRVDPNNWCCPRVGEGVSECIGHFWSDGEQRRTTRYADERRYYDDEKTNNWGTFACRFYDRCVTLSPCESRRPGPIPNTRRPMCKRIVEAPLTFLQQNMALLPMFYKGACPRESAVDTLIYRLRLERPDIVALSECFVNDERERITSSLSDVYPYYHEGPDQPGPLQDGGLLLLSRHAIVQRHSTIYRHCTREDCLTCKGALHVRISVPGHPVLYDVFHTHMQSCPTEFGIPIILPNLPAVEQTCWKNLRYYQVLHLRFFVHAYSSPNRPALLMGDFNHDALNAEMYTTLLNRLGNPDDLWLQTGTGSAKGVTHDHVSTFSEDAPLRTVDDPSRGQEGARLDYFFSWRAWELMQPTYTDTNVVIWQTTPGRDISDHYGLFTRQTQICEVDVDHTQAIRRVTVVLKAFHCLVETGGVLPAISREIEEDEVEFEIFVRTATGQSQELKTDLIEDIDAGTYYEFADPLTMTFNDPGDGLYINIIGWEVDDSPFGETGRSTLGPVELSISRRELLFSPGTTMQRVPPLLLGDDGEYAVMLEITITV